MNILGSSETTREILLYNTHFYCYARKKLFQRSFEIVFLVKNKFAYKFIFYKLAQNVKFCAQQNFIEKIFFFKKLQQQLVLPICFDIFKKKKYQNLQLKKKRFKCFFKLSVFFTKTNKINQKTKQNFCLKNFKKKYFLVKMKPAYQVRSYWVQSLFFTSWHKIFTRRGCLQSTRTFVQQSFANQNLIDKKILNITKIIDKVPFSKLSQFQFQNYLKNGTPLHKPKPNIHFLEWFIGFFEAEGFLIHCVNHNKQRFGIVINQKDPILIYTIRTQLGFGKISYYIQNKEKNYIYHIYNFVNLQRIILLLNGNLQTETKKKQFKKWIFLLNSYYTTTFFVKKKKNNIGFQNGWLSGFLQSVANFWINPENIISKNKKNSLQYNIKITFYIIQKNEFKLMQNLQSIFKIDKEQNYQYNMYNTVLFSLLKTNSLKSQQRILKYLKYYPFIGSRQKMVHRWARVIRYITQKDKYKITGKSITKLTRLIESTNQINFKKLQ